MLGKLGRPYKISYTAKNFASGLTNIVARVEKPNGTYIGLFPLIEEVDSFYAGSYYFNLVLSNADLEGEYTVSIVEPTSGHREIFKVTMEREIDVTFNFEDFDVKGKVTLNQKLKARIFPLPILKGTVQEQSVMLTGKILNNALVGKIVTTNQLKAKIILEC